MGTYLFFSVYFMVKTRTFEEFDIHSVMQFLSLFISNTFNCIPQYISVSFDIPLIMNKHIYTLQDGIYLYFLYNLQLFISKTV